jgi:hypothetical protein
MIPPNPRKGVKYASRPPLVIDRPSDLLGL